MAANVALPDPAGVKVVRVETTAELRDAVLAAAAGADAVVMAAAPADFRPGSHVSEPRSRRPTTARAPTIELVQNPDILAELVRATGPAPARSSSASPPRPATTPAPSLELRRAKLARKGCDLLVVNDVSGGAVFGSRRQRGRDPRRRRRARPTCRAGRRPRWRTSIWDQVVAPTRVP